jgi:hypothetical protein
MSKSEWREFLVFIFLIVLFTFLITLAGLLYG